MGSLAFRLYFWCLLPFLLCLGFTLCSCIPFHFFTNYAYRFNWSLVPIFYFAIYNPKCLSSWAVFLLGVFAELLTASPFGVITFCYVLLFFGANFFRKYLLELTFWPLWGVFCLFLICLEGVAYLFVNLLTSQAISFSPIFMSFVVISFSYPFLMRLCAYVDEKIGESV